MTDLEISIFHEMPAAAVAAAAKIFGRNSGYGLNAVILH